MSRMQCVTPCENPKRLVGHCCPLCPASAMNLTFGTFADALHETNLGNVSTTSISIMEEGESQINGLQFDKCTKCKCKDDWCHCFRSACPALDCEESDQFLPEGACCMECRRQRTETTRADSVIGLSSSRRCDFMNRIYKDEQSFRPDPCTICRCEAGAVLCRRFVCPVLNCPEQRLYYDKRLCCPLCRNRDPLPCKFEEKEYKVSDFNLPYLPLNESMIPDFI